MTKLLLPICRPYGAFLYAEIIATDVASMGAIQFTSDQADALNLLDIFEESNLFEHVRPYCVISPVGPGFPIPNDPGFYQQWYLKQDITGGDFNSDLPTAQAD